MSRLPMLTLLAALPLLAGGTIRVETRTKMFMGEGTSTEWVTADKKKTEMNLQMGGMMAGFARMGGMSGHTITIDRVDKGVVWTLNPDTKTYRERPIGVIEHQPAPGQQRPAGKGGHSMRVVDSGMKVTVTGKKQVINSWPCSQYLVEGFIEMEDTQTHERSKWVMNSELWTTPAAPLLKRYQDAEAAYARARMAKMGITSDSELAGKLGFEALAGRNGMQGGDLAPAMAKMGAELRKISGVAILTKFNWTVSGGAASAPKQKQPDPEAAAMMKRMGINMAPGGGIAIGGEVEIKSVKEEETDFEIPAGYKRVEK